MKTCVSVVVIGLAASAAMAQRSPETLTRSALFPETASSRVITLINTGFEAPEFVAGSLEPQRGWSSSGTDLPWQQVSRSAPFAGEQHVRLAFDASVMPGTQRLVFTPNMGAQLVLPSTTSMQINLSNDGGADYDVIGQAPSQGFLTWRVRFSFAGAAGTGPGTILVLAVNDEGFLGFQNTGVTWAEGAYRELRVEVDPAANLIRYFYGGAQIFTTTVFAGTTTEQLVFRTDNFQVDATETADIDNINLTAIPTPGALMVLGLAGLVAGRRRRA